MTHFMGTESGCPGQARGEARCRNVPLEDGKPATGTVLAGRILAQDSSLDLANETLRRFLQDEDQMTSSEIIRAIAAYLIEESWLSGRGLESFDENTESVILFVLLMHF